MWFWYFMLVCDLLVPVCMIIGGRVLCGYATKKISGWCGYRSARSMKNMDTWKFANEYCGRLWRKLGWIMLVPSALAHIPFYGRSVGAIGTLGLILCTVQCVVMLASILPTERALRRNFTKEGLPR